MGAPRAQVWSYDFELGILGKLQIFHLSCIEWQRCFYEWCCLSVSKEFLRWSMPGSVVHFAILSYSNLSQIKVCCQRHYFSVRSVTVCLVFHIHIHFPPTSYIGLILRSTAVATASRSTIEGTMRVLWCYCDKRLRSYYACSSIRVPS